MWKRVDSDRYYEMLEVLPPAHWTGKGFLVGEPATHRTCKITGTVRPTFAAFIALKGRYYEGPDMTITEFDVFDVRELGDCR